MATRYTRYGDDPNAFQDQWGALYDYDPSNGANPYTASRSNDGSDLQYAPGALENMRAMYAAAGLNPDQFMKNNGYGYSPEFMRPTQFNGGVYVPAGSLFESNPYDADPKLAAARQLALQNAYTDTDGTQYVRPQDLYSIRDIEDRKYKITGDGFEKLLPGLATAFVLGPLAGAAGASGGSAFTDLLGQYGFDFGNMGGGSFGSGGGSGGTPGFDFSTSYSSSPSASALFSGGGTDLSSMFTNLFQTGGGESLNPFAGATASAAGTSTSWLDKILSNPSTLLSAGSNLASGLMGSNAAGNAADAQLAGTQAGINAQRDMFNQIRADNAPFLKTGVDANARLAYLLGLPGAATSASGSDPSYGSMTRKFAKSDLDADPVYQSGLEFGLNEGRKGINQRAARSGIYDSGATLKELTRYGNDYGSLKANDSFNRYNTENTNIFNRLAGVSGAGQTAANTVTGAGINTANNQSSLYGDIGNSRAAGIVGGANAWGNAITGLNTAYNNQQSRDLLERILSGRGY